MTARSTLLPAPLLAIALVAPARATLPLDCLPDAVERWDAALPAPEARFGAMNLPGIVLGPPGESSPVAGSTTVASLGAAGVVVLRFDDLVIEDRPGPDFIVFENAFFVGSVPATDGTDYSVFTEPGLVDVSADGTAWHRFPFDAAALSEVIGHNATRAQQRRLAGLAGITPTFTGNWTIPDDLLSWDAAGTGGVSGAGGDAFDLASVGLAEARFVRLTDAGARNGPAGSGEGFDLDALVVLHGRPRLPTGPDADHDRLLDADEVALFGSDPLRADSDADGTDDGREVAGCRNPNGPQPTPWWVREPRLWLRSGSCTELRWTFLGSGVGYDLLRTPLETLAPVGGSIDLGPAVCLQNDALAVRSTCDPTLPLAGRALTYLVRRAGEAHYGWSSDHKERHAPGGCP